MQKKLAILVLLTTGFLVLSGESCVLKNRNIHVPLKGNAVMDFTSQGSSDIDFYEIDFFMEMQDIENDADADIKELVSASIEKGYWRLVKNRGPDNTTISGGITITRLATGTTEPLILPTSITIEEVGMEFVPAPLEKAGLDLLTAGFDEYVDYRNGLLAAPDLRYRFDWSSSAGPVDADFDWEARIRYTITGTFEVEVPEIW